MVNHCGELCPGPNLAGPGAAGGARGERRGARDPGRGGGDGDEKKRRENGLRPRSSRRRFGDPSDARQGSRRCRALAQASGARITLTEKHAEGLAGADFVYTDVWVSMGEADDVWQDRIALLTPYRVDSAAMARTANPHAKFLHCLPAFHNRDTQVGESTYQKYGLECMEVTDEVFESPASVVFDQAENRMHTIKAVLVATMGA